MDQVLFSEPSTKMKEQMERIRTEEAKRIIQEQKSDLGLDSASSGSNENSSGSGDGNSDGSPPTDTVTSEEQKFLEDRFGKQ